MLIDGPSPIFVSCYGINHYGTISHNAFKGAVLAKIASLNLWWRLSNAIDRVVNLAPQMNLGVGGV